MTQRIYAEAVMTTSSPSKIPPAAPSSLTSQLTCSDCAFPLETCPDCASLRAKALQDRLEWSQKPQDINYAIKEDWIHTVRAIIPASAIICPPFLETLRHILMIRRLLSKAYFAPSQALNDWVEYQAELGDEWFTLNENDLNRVPALRKSLVKGWKIQIWSKWEEYLRTGFNTENAKRWVPDLYNLFRTTCGWKPYILDQAFQLSKENMDWHNRPSMDWNAVKKLSSESKDKYVAYFAKRNKHRQRQIQQHGQYPIDYCESKGLMIELLDYIDQDDNQLISMDGKGPFTQLSNGDVMSFVPPAYDDAPPAYEESKLKDQLSQLLACIIVAQEQEDSKWKWLQEQDQEAFRRRGWHVYPVPGPGPPDQQYCEFYDWVEMPEKTDLLFD